jgi:hypothetical protein
MTTYSAITSGQIDAESPIDTVLAGQWTNNVLAMFEGDASASGVRLQNPALATLATASPNTIFFTDNTEISGGLTSYQKVFEFKCLQGGILNFTFTLKSNVGSYTAYGRIYKNGAAEGTERSTTSTSYQTYNEEITVARGDLLQLYVKSSNSTYGVATCNLVDLMADINTIIYPGVKYNV